MAAQSKERVKKPHAKARRQKEKALRRAQVDWSEEFIWVENCWDDWVPRLPDPVAQQRISQITSRPWAAKCRLVVESLDRAYVIVHPKCKWPHLAPLWNVRE